MLTDAELAGMRATSAGALPDTCSIERAAADPPTFNHTTGSYDLAAPTVVYDGPCRLRAPTAAQLEVIFGDSDTTRQRFVLTLPADVPDIQLGDVAFVTSSSDPHIGRRAFRVSAVPSGSWLIDRRVGVEVITQGRETEGDES